MTLEEINIRDPFVLPFKDTYYMYGTRAKTCWGLADGFDCYTSKDLVNWDGPFEVFHKPENFWADKTTGLLKYIFTITLFTCLRHLILRHSIKKAL